MSIRVEQTSLRIGDVSVSWFSPYLTQSLVRNAVLRWAPRLNALKVGDSIYLPYSISDEFVEAFEGTMNSDWRVTLRVVLLDCVGFDPERDDALTAMENAYRVLERRERILGEFDRKELSECVIAG